MQKETSMDNVLELHDVAVGKLKEFIEGDDTSSLNKTEEMRIKASMTAFNGTAREMATWRAKESIQLGIIREMAKDKEQIRTYVRATMPEYYPEKD